MIFGETQAKCDNDTSVVLKILQSLGFIINREKSSLTPKTQCKFLGFVFDSKRMTIGLPMEKRQKIFGLLRDIKKSKLYNQTFCTNDRHIGGGNTSCKVRHAVYKDVRKRKIFSFK